MTIDHLSSLTQAQRDRLAYAELRLRFVGEIRRQDLVARFGIQEAAATRDIAQYKKLAPGNLEYDTKNKLYVRAEWFRPLFDFPPERVLSWLTQGFGDGEPMRLKPWVISEVPTRLTHPDLDVLAAVTRAIHQECPLAVEYHSISSGITEREIVPFALIDNGLLCRDSSDHQKATRLRTQAPSLFVLAQLQQHAAGSRFRSNQMAFKR